MKVIAYLTAFLLAVSGPVFARGGGSGGHSGGHTSGHSSHSSASHSSSHSHSSRSSAQGNHHSGNGIGHASSHQSKQKSAPGSSSVNHRSTYTQGVARDSEGRIMRDSKAKHEFMKQTGYPNGRPSYVVDHVVPLKHGGKDVPSNMQWQTKEAAKAKDKWE